MVLRRGGYNKGVETPISANTGGMAEVMFTQTLEAGGGDGGYVSLR